MENKGKRKATFKHIVPQCTSPSEFKEWMILARLSKANNDDPRFIGFCSDCLPEYQCKMKQQGKCENPDVVFEEDKFGIIQGVFKECN